MVFVKKFAQNKNGGICLCNECLKGPGQHSQYRDSATGWIVRGSNPSGGSEIFRTRPDWPWGTPSLLYNRYRVFPGGKAAGAWRQPPTHI